MESVKKGPDRVVIAGVWLKSGPSLEESFKELAGLVEAAGGQLVGEITQNLEAYQPATLMGQGKLKELKDFVDREEVDLVVFDQELSGIQMRNIEDILGCGVLDRTGLILDIFAKRAKTKEGKLQVHLAQLQYRLSHLIGMKNLSRLGGGIGTRGPGEQKLETDRRHIRRQMDRIKKDLEGVKRHRATGRKRRLKSKMPLLSLVGYTNAGKSSLLNRMLEEGEGYGKKVLAKDMPFATLDSSLRQINLPYNQELLVSDTVGFISNLPTSLIKAFYSTLEEVVYADLLIHLLDGSTGDLQVQYDTTWQILSDLEVLDIPMVLVINKMDLAKEGPLALKDHGEDKVYISVKEDPDLGSLYKKIQENLAKDYMETDLYFSYHEQDLINQLLDKYEPTGLDYENQGVHLRLRLPKEEKKRLEKYQRRPHV
ncbi:MAG: GTPase HflX [Tissierellia bacterium]|nr:GTPase HflX [Tissierellia bacterium]